MKKKLIVTNSLLITFCVMVVSIFGYFINRSSVYKQAETNIVTITNILVDSYYDVGGILKIDEENVRETIIARDGTVLYDSEEVNVGNMENHLDREEIQAALNGTPKVVYRQSNTISTSMLYYAEKVDISADGYVFIRVALLISGIDYFANQYLPWMLLVVIITIGLSILIYILFSNNLMKPLKAIRNNLKSINEGTYNKDYVLTKDADLNKTIMEINILANSIETSLNSEKEERNKFEVVFNSVSDAIIVLNQSSEVLLFNNRAEEVFKIKNVIGRPYNCLSNSDVFIQNIGKALRSDLGISFDLNLANKVYYTKAIKSEEGLLFIVLTDVTEEINNQKLRSDFFSNASHELKIPLTSIRGFSDLLKLKNKDKELDHYIDRINEESLVMVKLINDMLSLSKLEQENKVKLEVLDLSSLIKEVNSSLDNLMLEKKVKVNLSGDAEINGNKEDLSKLFKNIIENGIIYNNENGVVDINIVDGKDNVKVVIKDNGIGIPEEDLSRIYERFYRVDKSRTRDTGGTGLGLAIVKHVCELYKIDKTVNSKLGEGTIFTFIFKK